MVYPIYGRTHWNPLSLTFSWTMPPLSSDAAAAAAAVDDGGNLRKEK